MIGFVRSAVQKKICSKKGIEVGTNYKSIVKKATSKRGGWEVIGIRERRIQPRAQSPSRNSRGINSLIFFMGRKEANNLKGMIG